MNQNKHNQYSQLASKEHARRPQTQDMPHITARISSLVTPAINDTYKSKRQEGLSHHQALRESLAARKEDTKNESDYNLLTTVELVGDFVEASHELNELRDEEDHRPLQYSEKQYKKRLLTDHIIPFNHSIKELINTDPSFTIGGLSGALTQAYAKLYRPHNQSVLHPGQKINTIANSEVLHEIQSSINGMRHELAAETLLAAQDIDYDYRVTAAEDKAGVDLFVEIDGVEYGIDIKASRSAQDRANRNPRSYAVATGLSDSDFTGIKGTSPHSLAIPLEVARAKGPAFEHRIRSVLGLSSHMTASARRLDSY